MTHYAELAPVSVEGVDAFAVGWLSAGHHFETGHVDQGSFRALMELLVNPWQPAASAGRHPCPMCRFTGGPAQVSYEDVTVNVGSSLLFVPGDRLYVAPSLIVHYIDAHGYEPPGALIDAVMQCPRMRSMDYFKALRRHGVRVTRNY